MGFRKYLWFALLLALTTSACGYRMANRAVPSLPATVRTIAVPTFRNETFRFKIEETLTEAVIREMLSRTSYRVQSSEAGSDAVMNGVVTAIYSSPIVFDPNSGRTTEVLVTVSMRVTVQDAATRQTLYEANDLVFREPYQISSDPTIYFGEDQAAIERLSRQVASSLVATLIGNF
jgi:outer membrane lipopolysaccharide assembly protein LptE/RlpB